VKVEAFLRYKLFQPELPNLPEDVMGTLGNERK
jgi:hypothetical protein